MYHNKYSFNENKNIEKYANESLTARYDKNVVLFYQQLKEFKKFTPGSVKTKTKKEVLYKTF